MTQRRVILVTGAAQGIGLATSKLFLKRGDHVVMADKDRQALREAMALENHGEEAHLALPLDISKESDVRRAVQQVIKRFGRLDVLVNNAGMVIESTPGFDVVLWNKVIATNLTGTFLCAKYASPHLKKSRGSIVNIASTRALMSEPFTESYSASKGGILALTHSLAISLGPEIRVNAISPGWILTDEWKKASQRSKPKLKPIVHTQHPVGRIGSPQDIANLVYFLASEDAGFITGQNYVADGGMTKKMIYVD